MESTPTITPVAEVQATPELTVEKTIGEVLETKALEVEKPNTVPEHIFLSQKKDLKETQRELKDLKASIENGATPKEVSATIKAIAEEYDVDPSFLDKLANTIRSESKNDLQDEISSKFRPLEEKEKQAQIDKTFETHYNQAINTMPEFAQIVNPGVIKALSLLPQNGNKTFSQLIEETYGNAISGKRTMQSTTTGGGKESEPLDYQRASSDPAYFDQVMANPKQKAEYNSIMLRSGF